MISKIKKVMLILSIVLYLGCSDKSDNELNILSPEEIGLKAIEYTYTFNVDGLKKVTMGECTVGFYGGFSRMKKRFVKKFEEKNIDFLSKDSHDFSGIKCSVINDNEKNVELLCSGNYKLYDKSHNVSSQTEFEDSIVLIKRGSGIVYRPPACK